MDDKKMVDEEALGLGFEDHILDLHAPISEHVKRMTPADWRREFVDDQMTCCLCGQGLTFKHSTDFALLAVEEEASCLACQIQVRKLTYNLQ